MGWQKRLSDAIEGAGYNLKAFASRLSERGVRSSSYSSVWAYLNKPDPAAPPMEFFEAAGDILGVRPAWLAFGDGERTDHAEHLDRRIEEQAAGTLPAMVTLPLDDWGRGALVAAWAEVARYRSRADLGEELMGDVQLAVESALRLLNLPRRDGRLQDDFNDYAAAVALAVRRYARAARREREAIDAED